MKTPQGQPHQNQHRHQSARGGLLAGHPRCPSGTTIAPAKSSVQQVWAQIGELWKTLLATLVSVLEDKVERDQHDPGPSHRLRVGLYTFDANEAAVAASPAPRKAR
jgi:hypothetical protein